ncbi:MAG: 7-cyano-7-deazaguanine synthase, partial [Synergistes sp.]|nr:7-cyano-7-deazaguanine synthase [Synergistes sp.]
MTLNEFFHEHPRCVLAFSGGVDSAYLLFAARECGADVRPCFVKTPFQPQFELEDASRLASELGFEMRVIERDILCDDSIV